MIDTCRCGPHIFPALTAAQRSGPKFLIRRLNQIISGWAAFYRTVVQQGIHLAG